MCQVHPFLCGKEGVELIRKDLRDDAVNSVVIAACSPRVKTDAFAFDPTMVFDRVNIREHVAWCQKPKDEDTQMMAEDYLRMGIVKAQKMEPSSPCPRPSARPSSWWAAASRDDRGPRIGGGRLRSGLVRNSPSSAAS